MMVAQVWIARKICRVMVHFSNTHAMMIRLHCINLDANALPIDQIWCASPEHRRGFTHTSMSQLQLSLLPPTHPSPLLLQQQAFVCSRHDSSCRVLSTQHPSRCSPYLRDGVLRVTTYSFKHLCSSLSIALWTFLGPASSISSSSSSKKIKNITRQTSASCICCTKIYIVAALHLVTLWQMSLKKSQKRGLYGK